MPRLKLDSSQSCPTALQQALDLVEVAGSWDWNIAANVVRADAFVALLFNVDPEQAAAGLPLSAYIDGVHPDDRNHVQALILGCIEEDAPFVAEYRVRSADGVTRWVLDRGNIMRDASKRPVRGRGIIVEITQSLTGRFTSGVRDSTPSEPPLERAAEHLIAAYRAIAELRDPKLKAEADALLLEVGRKLAQQELLARRKSMN